MEEIIHPPKGPKPVKPKPLVKTKNITRKLLKKILGEGPKIDKTESRWTYKLGTITLRQFCEQLISEAKSQGVDPDSYWVRPAASINSIAIESPYQAETDEAYQKRLRKYQEDLEPHLKWDALSPSQKKEMHRRILAIETAKKLQQKKDKLKQELLELNDKLSELQQEVR